METLGENYTTIIPATPEKRNGMNCKELKVFHEHLMKIIVCYSTLEYGELKLDFF